MTPRRPSRKTDSRNATTEPARERSPRVENGDAARRAEETIANWYLSALALAVVVAFFALLKYFLVQEEFVLLERAAFHPFDAIGHFFGRSQGQFRPLSKGLYFAIAYRLFHVNALQYHIVSIALHVINAALTYMLLRRLRVGLYGALTGATLFALSSAHFTTLAWACCIQQLLALMFMLQSLNLGVDAFATGARRPLLLSLAAYAAALMCLEQAVALPLVLALIAALGLYAAPERIPVRRALSMLRWHGAVLVAYGAFMVFWKTLPESGLYHPSWGKHVFLNMWTHAARTAHYFVELPALENIARPLFYKVNVLIGVVIVYHLLRRRWRPVVLALSYFLLTSLPLLGLVNHAYYYQTYVVGFWLVYLIGLAAQDVYALARVRVVQIAMLAAVLVTSTWLSRHFVSVNESTHYGKTSYERSFVVRRSKIAQRAYDGMLQFKRDGAKRVIMFYGRMENADQAIWNVANVREALGTGSAIRLMYDDGALDVDYVIVTDSTYVDDPATTDIFLYSDFGDISMVVSQEPETPPVPVDSSEVE